MFHQRREELPRCGLEAALALHDLEAHAGDLARVALQVLFECEHAVLDGILSLGVVERNLQNVSPQRKTFAKGGPIAHLGCREGATVEAVLEHDDPIRWRVLLEDDLEGVLVRHGARQ